MLGEADTRAPLLTGGIGFGRMVPMRLLPFRVICLLGMNDGDFPRRDAAAGLNRLTAELGTERRRAGDRSTREDDRFLFLQLFASAQDVLYLSYLGADARDGSVREPSLLVSELLASAAQQHADPRTALRELVLRHPLQPFAAAAFGAPDEEGPEPRRFSYRQQWRPAVDSLAGQRQPLAPWLDAAFPADASDAPASLSIDDLRRLFGDPAGQFLRHRLGMRLPEGAEQDSDVEPLLAPAQGLEQYELQQQVFDAAVTGDTHQLYERLRARALLPSGPLGRRQLEERLRQLQPYAQVFKQWRGDAVADSRRLQVPIEGVELHGRLSAWYPAGLARVQLGGVSGRAAIRHGLEWLLLRAAGERAPYQRFFEHEEGLGPHPMDAEPLPPAAAQAALAELLSLYRQGLQAPLAFAPYSSWKYYRTAQQGDLDKAIKEAAAQWQSDVGWSESAAPALRLVHRGSGPFADAQHFIDFASTSYRLYTLLEQGRTDARARSGAAGGELAAMARCPGGGGMNLPATDDPFLQLPLQGVRLIEASAGTGKTFTLATLVTRLVVERGLRIGQILAVTFTEAATQELRRRIRERLALAVQWVPSGATDAAVESELAAAAPDARLTAALLQAHLRASGESPVELQRRLQRAVEEIDLAAIFTIHGFCARVLREHALETGQALLAPELLGNDCELLAEVAADLWRLRSAEAATAEDLIRLLAGRPGHDGRRPARDGPPSGLAAVCAHRRPCR